MASSVGVSLQFQVFLLSEPLIYISEFNSGFFIVKIQVQC